MSELQPLIMTSQAARRVVAAFKRYGEAQQAVDYLSDQKFPVEHITIVGENFRLVEQASGRLTWLKTTVKGLLNGAITGFLFGGLLGLFVAVDPYISVMELAIWGLCFGVFVGSIMGSIAYASTSGRRYFTSLGSMHAEQYGVLADIDIADEAQRLLTQRHNCNRTTTEMPSCRPLISR